MFEELRDAITLAVADAVGELIPCEAHPRSRFVSADLQKALLKSNLALRVGFLGILDDPAESLTPLDIVCTWAVFICAKDGGKTQRRRDQYILGVALDVIKAVKARKWTTPAGTLGLPERVRFTPVYQGDEDASSSAAIWAVTWRQSVAADVTDDETTTDLRPFRTLITNYDLAPQEGVIDATDTIDMEFEP